VSGKTKRLDLEGLKKYALRALGGRAHSLGELRDKLMRRAASAGDVDAVIAQLKAHGYLDDRRYAESVAAAQLENRGVGEARALNELRKRRLAPAVAQKAVTSAYAGADEVALIEAWLRRKYRNTALDEFLSEPKNLASAYRRLRGAGFTSGNSLRVLKRFAREPEILDALEGEDDAATGRE